MLPEKTYPFRDMIGVIDINKEKNIRIQLKDKNFPHIGWKVIFFRESVYKTILNSPQKFSLNPDIIVENLSDFLSFLGDQEVKFTKNFGSEDKTFQQQLRDMGYNASSGFIDALKIAPQIEDQPNLIGASFSTYSD